MNTTLRNQIVTLILLELVPGNLFVLVVDQSIGLSVVDCHLDHTINLGPLNFIKLPVVSISIPYPSLVPNRAPTQAYGAHCQHYQIIILFNCLYACFFFFLFVVGGNLAGTSGPLVAPSLSITVMYLCVNLFFLVIVNVI